MPRGSEERRGILMALSKKGYSTRGWEEKAYPTSAGPQTSYRFAQDAGGEAFGISLSLGRSGDTEFSWLLSEGDGRDQDNIVADGSGVSRGWPNPSGAIQEVRAALSKRAALLRKKTKDTALLEAKLMKTKFSY
jgi:hypothetical protein